MTTGAVASMTASGLRMEPLFAAWNGAGHPPRGDLQGFLVRVEGREQNYEKRMGFPSYNHPWRA